MVVDTKLYDILGVKPEATDRELKKAFMLKARELHPDKNQDDPNATEKFQELNEAYEILKKPETREIYDKYGPEGLAEGGAGAGDFGDILSHLFGFGGGGRNARPRTRDIGIEVTASLEDLYNGREKHVKVTRHIICKSCNGNGTKDGKPAPKCDKCDGEGQVGVLRNLGGMAVQTVAECPECNGRGVLLTEDNKCKECNGDTIVEETKTLAVNIERGMEDGSRIVFEGASDEVPGADTGNLVVVVREKPHELFQRKHANLKVTKRINLTDALLGTHVTVPTLDGRTLVVDVPPVVQSGSVIAVEREGMPERGNAYSRGTLFVELEVVMPTREQVTPELEAALRAAVPPRDEAKKVDLDDDAVYTVTSRPAEENEFEATRRAGGEHRKEAYGSSDVDYEDDYDDEDGQGGPQCGSM